LSAGEILVARSNTAELVGRAAKFEGEPEGVVASDLTIRVKARQSVSTDFLASYLSFLYTSGYWREKSGGASGSMKKITRTQLQNLAVPVPGTDEQVKVATLLNLQMVETKAATQAVQAELAAIDSLPAALLRRASCGEL
jgi:type I restriction enzyme S subunit